jgi:hypothetical protein
VDERISKALAELKRAGISLPQLVSEAARKGEAFSNEDILDVVWAVAEQRGYARGVEELGVDGKSGKKPKKARLEVLKWLALQEFLSEALALGKLGKVKNSWERYRPKGLSTLVAWIQSFGGSPIIFSPRPRQEPLYDNRPLPLTQVPTYTMWRSNSSPPRQQ